MRLGELLGLVDPERIDEMCKRLVPGGEEVPQTLRATSLESLLRDSGFVEQTLFQHKPPVLALLRELLEARNHRAPIDALRTSVMEATERWCVRVGTGELAARRDTFPIYRRLLAAAWSNDLRLDASERALLGLLRKEVGMSTIEHFLISHHSDIQPFWMSDDCFELELQALVGNGIVFRVENDVVIPEEFVHRVQKALGLELSRGAALRLLNYMSNEDLREALERYEIKKSGDKAERVARIIDELVPMTNVLDAASIQELQEIARETGAAVSGSKDDLIARLIEHFEDGKDLVEELAGDVSRPVEPKQLDEGKFQLLFQHLSGHQLELLCRRHELRHSGTKEQRVSTLWASPLAEKTLLRGLRNPDLVELCREHRIDASGAKDALIARLILHFV